MDRGLVPGFRGRGEHGEFFADTDRALRDLEGRFVKCVILAGGKGTRIAEESSVRPKPMLEIGGRPILWHIMGFNAAFGVN